MEYVELLRARRVLVWYGSILLALFALGMALAFKDGPPHIQMSLDANPTVPFGTILAGASFGPIVLAAFLAVCFDAEYKTAAITWTRPMSRTAIALRYVAVDFGALICAWLFTAAVAMLCLVILGLTKYLTFTANEPVVIALAFGCAVMWYGLVVFVTMLVPGRANAVAGASWAYALIVPGLAQIGAFPLAIHQVLVALNYLNPLAYLGNLGSSSGRSHPLIPGSHGEHAVAAWLIGLAAVALGTWLWSTREVPA